MSEQSRGEVLVRRFEPTEADAVVAMMRDLAAFHGDEAAASASDLVRYGFGPDRVSTVWLALRDGEPCGFAVTYDWMNYVGGFPVRNIDLLFVRAGARRGGVGRALLAALGRDAGASGCRRVTVGAEADNAEANSFYRGAGFEPRPLTANRYVLSGEALDRSTLA